MTTNAQVSWYGDDLIKQILAHQDEALFEGGELLKTEAAARAPEFTGRLKKSGYASTMKRSSYVKKRWYKKERKPRDPGIVAVGFAAPHSHMAEFGTSRMAARPFLRPTLDELKSKIGEKIVVVWSRKLK